MISRNFVAPLMLTFISTTFSATPFDEPARSSFLINVPDDGSVWYVQPHIFNPSDIKSDFFDPQISDVSIIQSFKIDNTIIKERRQGRKKSGGSSQRSRQRGRQKFKDTNEYSRQMRGKSLGERKEDLEENMDRKHNYDRVHISSNSSDIVSKLKEKPRSESVSKIINKDAPSQLPQDNEMKTMSKEEIPNKVNTENIDSALIFDGFPYEGLNEENNPDEWKSIQRNIERQESHNRFVNHVLAKCIFGGFIEDMRPWYYSGAARGFGHQTSDWVSDWWPNGTPQELNYLLLQ